MQIEKFCKASQAKPSALAAAGVQFPLELRRAPNTKQNSFSSDWTRAARLKLESIGRAVKKAPIERRPMRASERAMRTPIARPDGKTDKLGARARPSPPNQRRPSDLRFRPAAELAARWPSELRLGRSARCGGAALSLWPLNGRAAAAAAAGRH